MSKSDRAALILLGVEMGLFPRHLLDNAFTHGKVLKRLLKPGL
jgi:hypothetical protein